MSMGAGTDNSGFNSEINVTPMVDIMLVLLIIFMVVTPMLQHGVTVNLPKDLNNPQEDQRIIKDNSIVIAIPADGEYYLGKDRVTKEQVKDKVEKMLESDQEGRGQGCLYQERCRCELWRRGHGHKRSQSARR